MNQLDFNKEIFISRMHGVNLKISRSYSDTLTLSIISTDEGSVLNRNLYLTTHDTHNRDNSMPAEEFEPVFPAGERPKTHALDSAATGIGNGSSYHLN